MNILVVSQYFWPENFRINDLVEGLISKGNSVTVITGKPNYPSGSLDMDVEKLSDIFHGGSKSVNDYKNIQKIIGIASRVSTLVGIEKRLYK